jgi:UDP-GlcNAc:undecaprenyl-phosphate GlcNAc-1-phosphate transferase
VITEIIVFSIVLFLNLIGVKMYIFWAQKKVIVDQPNSRSSHDKPTIIGGGLLFAPLFLALELIFSIEYWMAGLGVTLGAVVSYFDDIKALPVRIRLPVHFISVILILFSIQIDWSLSVFVLSLVLLTGWINSFNFMDGINGISSIYAFIFFLSVIFTAQVTDSKNLPIESISVGIIASVLAFLFFNFRSNALCFMGDVGSVSLALIMSWFFLILWDGPSSLFLFLFVIVYAVDSVMTIFLRIYKRENIFHAHRFHLYQILANEKGIDHRIIAISYGTLQLLINLIAIYWVSDYSSTNQLIIVFGIYVFVSILYLIFRNHIFHKLNNNLNGRI